MSADQQVQLLTSLFALSEQLHQDEPDEKVTAGLAVDLLAVFLRDQNRIADALERIAAVAEAWRGS